MTHTHLVLTSVRYQDRQFLMWCLIQSPQPPHVVGFTVFILHTKVSQVSGLGKLFPYSFSFPGWSNKSNDIQQINRKSNFNMCTTENHISMETAKTGRQTQVCMSFWTKEGEVGNS